MIFSALRVMSSTLMRLSATSNSCSVLASAGKHHFFQEIGAADTHLAVFIDRSGGAQDIDGGYTAPLARQLVAAARAADAFEDAVADERLQHRLEMAWRQAVPGRQRLGGYRAAAALKRHVDHSSNRKDSFAREQRHEDPGNSEYVVIER